MFTVGDKIIYQGETGEILDFLRGFGEYLINVYGEEFWTQERNLTKLPKSEEFIIAGRSINATVEYGSPFTYKKVECECGSEVAKTIGHSTWCPKYEETII